MSMRQRISRQRRSRSARKRSSGDGAALLLSEVFTAGAPKTTSVKVEIQRFRHNMRGARARVPGHDRGPDRVLEVLPDLAPHELLRIPQVGVGEVEHELLIFIGELMYSGR